MHAGEHFCTSEQLGFHSQITLAEDVTQVNFFLIGLGDKSWG